MPCRGPEVAGVRQGLARAVGRIHRLRRGAVGQARWEVMAALRFSTAADLNEDLISTSCNFIDLNYELSYDDSLMVVV